MTVVDTTSYRNPNIFAVYYYYFILFYFFIFIFIYFFIYYVNVYFQSDSA